MELNEYLKERRKNLDLTLLDVAKACGVNEGTVSRWESGEIENMRRNKISALARVLRIDPGIIMEWIPVPTVVLTPAEEDLIIAYRSAPEGRKDSVRALLGI